MRALHTAGKGEMRRKVTDIEVPADVIQAAIDLADGYGVTIMPDDIEF